MWYTTATRAARIDCASNSDKNRVLVTTFINPKSGGRVLKRKDVLYRKCDFFANFFDLRSSLKFFDFIFHSV